MRHNNIQIDGLLTVAADTGCEEAARCVDCPLPACKYDIITPAHRRAFRTLTATEAGRRIRALFPNGNRKGGAQRQRLMAELRQTLAAEYGISTRSVRRIMDEAQKYWLPVTIVDVAEVARLHLAGHTAAAIAARLYVSQSRVRSALFQAYDEGLITDPRLTARIPDPALIRMRAMGATNRQIAAHLGANITAVEKRLRRLIKAGKVAPRKRHVGMSNAEQHQFATARYRQILQHYQPGMSQRRLAALAGTSDRTAGVALHWGIGQGLLQRSDLNPPKRRDAVETQASYRRILAAKQPGETWSALARRIGVHRSMVDRARAWERTQQRREHAA